MLASPTHGVVVVEVKGGLIAVKGGTWHQYDKPLKKSPIAQVRNAKHALVNRMRGIGIDLHGLWISHAVAMPDVGAIPPEGLGPDAPREILLGTQELADPAPAIERIVHERGPVAIDRYTRFLRALRPDIVLEGADSAVMPVATRRIDTDTRGRLEVLHGLDANTRVLVTGGAGTGKTWLVVEWAKRADRRGERTLVLTFNRPLADHLARVLDGTKVTVATYHDMIVQLLTPFGFAIVDHPDRDYWETVPTAALEAHAEQVGTPFDTVIIDEGQDMRPHWLASVERLLDPAGPKRLLMVADPAQSIYVDGFTPPAGSVVMPLEFNLRSARSVAQVVRHLGGPPPLPTAGGRMPVQHRRAGGVKEVRKHVRRGRGGRTRGGGGRRSRRIFLEAGHAAPTATARRPLVAVALAAPHEDDHDADDDEQGGEAAAAAPEDCHDGACVHEGALRSVFGGQHNKPTQGRDEIGYGPEPLWVTAPRRGERWTGFWRPLRGCSATSGAPPSRTRSRWSALRAGRSWWRARGCTGWR